MKTDNLFDNIPNILQGEDFSQLLKCRNVVIERIISSDVPDQSIYNQSQDEWVILVQGKAELKINDDVIHLKTGDYLFIPAHTPHKVLSTTDNCIWLAVHIN